MPANPEQNPSARPEHAEQLTTLTVSAPHAGAETRSGEVGIV